MIRIRFGGSSRACGVSALGRAPLGDRICTGAGADCHLSQAQAAPGTRRRQALREPRRLRADLCVLPGEREPAHRLQEVEASRAAITRRAPTQHRQVSESTTPPSTRNGEPVIALASREQRKATASAISSGLVSRLMIEVGRPVSMNARWCSGLSAERPIDLNISSTPSVRVGPGSTAFTVTPLAASA